jgi:hypothetical protein
MSRVRVAILLSIFMLVALPIIGGIQSGPPQVQTFVPGEVLLKFKEQASASDRIRLAGEVGAVHLRTFASQAVHWRVAPQVDLVQAIERLKRDPAVLYAEPNYLLSVDVTPNDPRYNELWGMNNTGQTGGIADADIDADTAWNVSTGSSSVLVGVIDTGVDYNHPDLAANIWTNPGEIPGNSLDDDNNGYVDDVHGYDFVNNDGDPFDDHGHGTHCSGTIGGVGNNGVGVVGVNWDVTIMGIKFLNSGGSGTTANAVLSVQYATMMGVDLTSNSWGGGAFSQTLYDAIAAAGAANIAFVAAAGNNGANSDTSPAYPAAYDLANIISVAATDDNDQLASFSNYGAVSVDIGAPGVDVLSTQPGNQYGLLSGTSMACPHVAGAYALVLSVSAPGIPVAQVKNILMNSADDIPALAGRCVSNGRLNIFFAIAEPDTTNPGMVDDLATIDPTSNTMGLTWTAPGDDGDTGTANSYEVRYSTGVIDENSWAAATRAGNEPTPGPYGTAEAMEVRNLVADTGYYFAVKAFDEWGNAGPLSNIATGTTLPPPTAAVAPTSVSDDLFTGQQSDHPIVLSNVGQGTLDFEIPAPILGEPMAIQPYLELGKDEPDPRSGDPVIAASGGPDSFGYRWVDSDSPGGPVFSWTDISGTGTPVAISGDDDTSDPIALGFNAPFYGTLFSSIRVCSNGWLSFTDSSTAYNNQPLPNSGAPANMVAPFWDDQLASGGGVAYFQSFGNKAIVQWTNMPHYSAGGPYTYQAIIEAGGAITFQYLNMNAPLDSATVGIQNATKTVALQVAFNQVYVHDNLAVRISSIPQWLTAFPVSGRIAAGGSKTINLHMNASGLEGGTYPAEVHILNNDPQNPDLVVNASLHVIGAPDAVVQPLSLPFGTSFLGQPYTQNLIVVNDGTDTLHVSAINSSHPGELTANPSSFNLAPHGSQNVTVTWTPAALGAFSGSLTVLSDDAGEPSIVVPVTGDSVPSPVMLVSPTSFSETLFSGNQVTRTLTITNTGGPDLIVDAGADQGNGQLVYADDLGAFGQGGPDAFGYRWKDSDSSGGPAFNFVDISGPGTPITFTSSDDSLSAAINMGMTFPFYGNNFTQLKVSTNGWLTFNTTETLNRNSNSALPGTGGAANMIAMFWDDLHLRTGNVKYYNDGSRFIVQYTGIGRFTPSTGSTYTFQVQLYPNGKVLCMYQTMTSTVNNSATIGIQNGLKTIGLTTIHQTGTGTPYVHDNLALQFSRTPDWLSVTPSHAQIPPSQSANFTVTFDSTERLGGVLNGAIVLTTNVPGQATEHVPATLTVVGAPIAAILPATFDYGTRFTGYSYLTSFQVVNTGTDTLNVSDVYSDDPTLVVEEQAEPGGGENIPEAAFPLAPGASRLFQLRWAPTSPGSLNASVHVISDDPVDGDRTMSVTGSAILPPVAAWSPSSFSESANVGDVIHRTLHVENNGGSDLNYVTQIGLNSGATVVVDHSPELKKDEEDTRPGVMGAGGPDVFGYTWRDSNEPGGPAFGWVDISAIGTPITFSSTDDGRAGPFPIGFPFPYYGQTFSEARVCTNGFLSFTDSATTFTNTVLPSSSAPANLLAVFWDDLAQRAPLANAKYYSDGNRFIVQWSDWQQLSPSTENYDFQVILYRNGRIVYQYQSMTTGDLASFTIGIQNAAKNDGLTVAFNVGTYMQNNLAVEFRPPAGWVAVTPDAGTIPPGGSVDLDVVFDTTELIGGDYGANIDLATNDPANALIRVPAALHVTGIPDINAAPTALAFANTYVGYTRTLPLAISNPGTDVLTVSGVTVTGDFSQTGLTTPVALAPGASIPVTVTFAPTSVGSHSGEITVTSDDPDEPSVVVTLGGEALAVPQLAVSPSSLSAFLPPSSQTTRTVEVCNTGGSDLSWSSDTNIISGGSVTQYAGAELGKDEIDTSPGILGAGGPDVFGYRWVDSDEPGGPVFSWVDITGVGTPITDLDADDEVVGPIALPFSFPYYGNSFNSFRLSSNGWLSFTYTGTTSFLTNSALPSTSGVDNMIAPFWDDLSFSSGHGSGSAYYHYDGSKFIVSFHDVPHYPSTGTGPYTFQVLLYPSGKIVYQYLSVAGTLNSQTIGIQNATETDGLTVVFNSDYVHDNLAVQIASIPQWATTAPGSGLLAPGACEDVTVTFDSTDLDHGVHESNLRFAANNDPYLETADVAATLTVNYKPVAEAGAPQTLECTGGGGASTMLDGTGSSDGDDDLLTYSWSGASFDDPTSATPIGFFPLGTTTASLTVNDGYEDSDPDTVDITVADTSPPSITCPSGATVECQGNLAALVALDPATGGDVCGGITITNSHNAGGADASGSYPLGSTTVTFTATDGSGNSASCSIVVTVVDTIAPTITVTPLPSLLWPPNHHMVDVEYDVDVVDICDPNPAVVLVSLGSSEADDANGGGDGHTTNDIDGAGTGSDDRNVLLRAERDGQGTGRTYTALYRATDSSGNSSSDSADVVAPHDLGDVVEPINLSVNGKTSTTITWPLVQGAVSYDVIRGDLAALRIQGSNINLGLVTCIERDSIDSSTVGNADTAMPAPGQVFFYAVQFFDGISDSSYGSESADRARVVSGGDCP